MYNSLQIHRVTKIAPPRTVWIAPASPDSVSPGCWSTEIVVTTENGDATTFILYHADRNPEQRPEVWNG